MLSDDLLALLAASHTTAGRHPTTALSTPVFFDCAAPCTLVPKMTCYMSNGALSSTQSLTPVRRAVSTGDVH